jgi:hypothetical protein
MKKILLLLLFVIPLTTFSQSKKSIDGFLDIPFGSDSATVKNALIAKGGIRIDSVCKKDLLEFTGLTIGGRKALGCIVKFVDNKVYQADFVFNDFDQISDGNSPLVYYDNFATDITAVYGKGQMSNNFGDVSNTVRIRRLISGNASVQTIWESKNKNSLSLFFQSVNQSLLLTLEYQDSTLWDVNAAKRRSDL